MLRNYLCMIVTLFYIICIGETVTAHQKFEVNVGNNRIEFAAANGGVTYRILAPGWRLVHNGRYIDPERVADILEMNPDVKIAKEEQGLITIIETNGGMVVGTVTAMGNDYLVALLDDAVTEHVIYHTPDTTFMTDKEPFLGIRIGDKILAYVNTKNQVKYITSSNNSGR